MSIQKIADDIKALTIQPVASDEYSAGYQAARHDAWLIAQEVADEELPVAAAVLAERDRCLKIVSEWYGGGRSFVMRKISEPSSTSPTK
ncbi:hypothetical protein WA845_00210 [Agrobacterium sp. CMT1]|uniref:hypothetical protein n=1 Tax=Agrobacterium sp. CMT1 TaxID=3128901 RepID=UPI003077C102